MSFTNPQVHHQQMPHGTTHVSVAIIGAGACGLSCALHLSDLGIECAVFERDAYPQGSTALSSGFIPAPNTRLQQSLGIEDSAQLFVQDIQLKSQGQSNLALAQAYADAVGKALNALESLHDFKWVILDQFLYSGHSTYRMHAVPEKTGQALISRLFNATEKRSIPIITEAVVKELWINDGMIQGITLYRPNSQTENYSCDALILCCNGYGGNHQLVKKYLPNMADAIFAGHPGNDGSAILWGEQLGAQLADLNGYQGHGSWAIPQGILITWALLLEGGIQVNALGRRFHNETLGYSEAAEKVLSQPSGVVWNIFDEPIRLFAQDFSDFREAVQHDAIKKADSITELALMINCDRTTLEKEIKDIQIGVADSTGRIFHRKLESPYYACKVTGALFHTQGGLQIDTQARVLNYQNEAFQNLWAAGGAARGVSGNDVAGYLSGNGLLSAFAGAYIAAQSVGDFKKNKNISM